VNDPGNAPTTHRPGPRRTSGDDGGRVDKHEALVRALVSGEMRFYQLPRDLDADEQAEIRRHALERMAGGSLAHIGTYSLDSERAATRHCENFLGVTQVPIGVAGPLTVRGDYIDGDVYVPLATTEGALIASISRGCAAIRQAGGATTYVEDAGMTRAPVFRTTGVKQSRELQRWVVDNEGEIRRLAEGTSRYLRLRDIRPFSFGSTVFLRFRFECGDAMGMNMATIACDRVVRQLIEPATGVTCVALSGNYCVDKKPAAINFQEGRGKRIHAEVEVSAAVLKRYLKTTAAKLVEVQYRKNFLGSVAANALGFNAHIANPVAAFFLATGQDLAHVVGASMGVTNLEERENGALYASIFLPDLPLGAVGGGTGLETQSEALALLGVRPDPERPGAAVMRLAEILGATVLAGELSLMAAFTSNDLASAHERLGRSQDATAAQQSAAVVGRPGAQPETVTVTAPGKVILMGEHAAVYGRPALLAALGLRLTAELSPLASRTSMDSRDGVCELDLPAVDVHEEVKLDDLVAYARAAKQRWEAYRQDPSPASFAAVRGEDPAHIVKIALGEAMQKLKGSRPTRAFRLRIDSELPVGSGFGSSAATAVATLAAYAEFIGADLDHDELSQLSLEVERRQHGQPSGVDGAAVVHGGLVWARRDLAGSVQLEPLEPSSPLLAKLRLFSTGTPYEPTGAVVAAVKAKIDADPLRYEDLFDRMERATWGLRQELARPRENPLRTIALIRQYQACLQALGVVPEETEALIRQVEEHGGAAKISGAGALSGPAAGSLLIYHPSAEEIDRWTFLKELPRYPVRLGAQGLRRERRT
jgi:hydroxymethylglutaryl-CoA reductase (NADPH)